MILPDSIPHCVDCPYCTHSESKLEWQNANPGSFVETLVYYCDNCKNGFTTTESDTISLKRYHSKKRSVYRKNKINKLGI
jgi:transcriptional regulator NrdR family protein